MKTRNVIWTLTMNPINNVSLTATNTPQTETVAK
jgi:hypothetical protein